EDGADLILAGPAGIARRRSRGRTSGVMRNRAIGRVLSRGGLMHHRLLHLGARGDGRGASVRDPVGVVRDEMALAITVPVLGAMVGAVVPTVAEPSLTGVLIEVVAPLIMQEITGVGLR